MLTVTKTTRVAWQLGVTEITAGQTVKGAFGRYLLKQGLATPTEPTSAGEYVLVESGGGWYAITQGDEIITKVRGEDAAKQKLAELTQ